MMNILKLLTAIGLLVIVLSSCRKETNATGMIRNYGPIELDGCGWVIEVNGTEYKPVNLASEYQVDSMVVTFDFKRLKTTAQCGLDPQAFEEINILQIH